MKMCDGAVQMQMKILVAFLGAIPLLLSSCTDSADGATPAVAKGGPVVVELFQSQGCSSCPPANAALNAVADRPGVIAISYAVTYWDRLGWKDRFADPAFTQRQYDYRDALGEERTYTPQVVLNGKRAIVGNGKGELDRAVKASQPVAGVPSIGLQKGNVQIGAGAGNASVWLIRYDPRTHNVAIGAGENSGRTLPHRNIVREFVKLGRWKGKAASFSLPAAKSEGLRSVILVQQGNAGPILSAKQL
jgi:hypothetical protein